MSFIQDVFAGAPQADKADLPYYVTRDQTQQNYNDLQNNFANQQNLANQLNPQMGSAIQNQNMVANQLAQQAQGQGPNPAMAMLNQQTANNVAQQNALMAGQRGASANAGMMARQAGMIGANAQQQAIGQGAVMQANQQLAAQNALMGLSGQQIGQSVGAQQGLGAQQLQMQGNMYGQAGQRNQLELAQQQGRNDMRMAGYKANMAHAGQMGAAINKAASSAFSMGGGGGGGAYTGGMINARGPVTKAYADGGPVIDPNANEHIQTIGLGPTDYGTDYDDNAFAFGGQAGAHSAVIDGIMQHFKQGGAVPGKASVAGDSPSNDTVPAMLSPGEIVIPRSVVNSANAPEKAAQFVAAVLAKKGRK